ncbi:hypothetical protein [uncultured Halomonas sp.]|uniref:hypothetical protein n=1 Tax=uncultured Halomonas sp. TaxID=173971 RepID=UPI00261CBA7E|nr:hypothetical protein [uncultured Halomonas sp.]
MAWKRINSKKYQVELDGELRNLSVPYGKVEVLIEEFFAKGGMVDPATGTVLTDIPTLVRAFGTMGDILLSEYDGRGKLVTEVCCREFSLEEIPQLFEIAVDVIQNFTKAVFAMQERMQQAQQAAAEPAAAPEKAAEEA